MLGSIIAVALRALTVHKLRSFLTMLGVVIGVAAVIALVAVGAGAQQEVIEQFESMGVNLLSVRPNYERSYSDKGEIRELKPLTNRDVEALELLADSVAEIAPVFEAGGTVAHKGRTTGVPIWGVTAAFGRVREWTVARGRFISEQDQATGALVAVLGQPVVKELFGARVDPIGQTIRINRQNFRVIGVLPEVGERGGMRDDSIVFLPLRTAQVKLGGAGNVDVGGIYLKVADPSRMSYAQAQVRTILRTLHRTPPAEPDDDFVVTNQAQTIKEFESYMQEGTILLGSIGAISLLVGGIGIMNIMLVSVTERTREVGLRKAMGAKRRHILLQFLVEASVLSLLGGLLGVGVGIGLAQLITPLLGATRSLVTPQSVALALGVSIAIGLGFGMYPANRAARLNPIDALRYE